MRGSIVKRGKGYSVVVELDADPITGKRRQKWHSGYRTKRQAEDALSELVNGVKTGTYVAKTKQTLAGYVGEWLTAIEPTVRPATHYSYGRNLRLHVLPYLGSTELHAVDAGMLNGLYATLLREGRRDHEQGGLSPRSVRYVHTIAHRAFKDAVKWGRLARNPADAADPPRASSSDRPESVTWTAQQLGTFLQGTCGDRHHTAYLVLATTGMRRGEALGLRWRDLDLDAGRASIRQTVIAVHHKPTLGTPKTAKGRRTVVLDRATVAALREHRKRQAADRLQMGEGWTDHDLVFCRLDGTLLHPERFSRSFGDAVRRLQLPPIRLHDLRHGWATMTLSAGVHPKVVQERLGHANIGITLDTYSHVTGSLHDDAAETVAALFTEAR
ncbi:MAG TPA: tyrosine-type recombinase/integrase [Nocardioidaceae bacterium]|nr:tyrosine-type recombinase/integrase [Nocardioidaceae bacterium]